MSNVKINCLPVGQVEFAGSVRFSMDDEITLSRDGL